MELVHKDDIEVVQIQSLRMVALSVLVNLSMSKSVINITAQFTVAIRVGHHGPAVQRRVERGRVQEGAIVTTHWLHMVVAIVTFLVQLRRTRLVTRRLVQFRFQVNPLPAHVKAVPCI